VYAFDHDQARDRFALSSTVIAPGSKLPLYA
jgi:hypothetical protein